MQKVLLISIVAISILFGNTAFAKRTPSYINIPKGETWEFFTDPISKYLSTDPDVVRVRRITRTKFSVRGLALGSVFIYIWDEDENIKTIKVTVIKPLSRPDANEKIISDIKQSENIKFNYTSSFYSGSSKSQYPINVWNYNGSFNQINISGNMPFGRANSIIQYEDYKGNSGLTYLKLESSSDKYYLNVGDSLASFSDIVLPHIGYQGIYFKASLLKNLDIVFASGSRGSSYWGKFVRNDTRPLQSFSGLSASFSPTDQIEINAGVITSSNEGTVNSLGAKYKPLKTILLSGDGALSAAGKKALSVETAYFGQNLFLKGIYRNISKDFTLPYDEINLRGTEGFFISGSHRPFSFVELSGEVNRYKNSYLQTNSTYNKDLRGDIRLKAGERSVFSYSPWKQDHSGFLSGGIGEGSISQFSHGFEMLGIDTIYARYEPIKFSDPRTIEAGYLEDKTVLGTRFDFSPQLSLNFENEWRGKTKTFSNVVENANVLRIILNYDANIGNSPFYTILNSRYSAGSDSNGKFSELLEDLEIGYKKGDDTKIYGRAKYVDLRGSTLNNIDRVENHFSFGVRYPLDTRISIKGSGDISGYVYRDTNRDGIYNGDEEGIPNTVILVNNKRYFTDKKGRYLIKNIAVGEQKVRLDTQSIESKYILTSQNPKQVIISQGGTEPADFGLIANSLIRGRIYKDVNNNKIFDKGDIPLPNIRIILGQNSAVSDIDGLYLLSELDEGSYNIEIDINSIPKNSVPIVPLIQRVNIKEGDIYEINIPFKSTSKN